MILKQTLKTLSLAVLTMVMLLILPFSQAAAVGGILVGSDFETNLSPLAGFNLGNYTSITEGTDSVYGKTTIVSNTGGVSYGGLSLADLDGDVSESFTIKAAFRRQNILNPFTLRFLTDSTATTYADLLKFTNNNLVLVDGVKMCSYKANTWYEIEMTYNKTGFIIFTINGGEFENARFYKATATKLGFTLFRGWYAGANIKEDNGFELGYFYYDSTKQVSKGVWENELNFESGVNVHDWSDASAIHSNGNWQIYNSDLISGTTRIFDVVDMDDSHGKALKVNRFNPYVKQLRHFFDQPGSFPDPAMNEQLLIVEGSYKQDYLGQLKLSLTPAVGMGTTFYIFESKSGTWDGTFLFCGTEATEKMPYTSGGWMRFRASLDFATDTTKLEYWMEDSPQQVITLTDTQKLKDITKLSQIVYMPLVGDQENSAGYLDDVRVYEKASLRSINSLPENGATGVSPVIMPTVSFNMPLNQESINGAVVTLTGAGIEDGDYTTCLSPLGNGICVKLNKDLKPNETYTLTVSNVTDIFGQKLTDAQTVTFTTCDLIVVTSCTFNGVEKENAALLPGSDLNINVHIKTGDSLTRDILVLYGIYEKDSDQFVVGDAVYKSTNEDDFSKILAVPKVEGKSYYAKVFIWNTFSSLKPYLNAISTN